MCIVVPLGKDDECQGTIFAWAPVATVWDWRIVFPPSLSQASGAPPSLSVSIGFMRVIN